jgi:hypothetical protein
MSDIKALAQRSKESLDRIQKEVQAKRMSLDAALGHAFIAGTEHMAELKKIQESVRPSTDKNVLKALSGVSESCLETWSYGPFGDADGLETLGKAELARRGIVK